MLAGFELASSFDTCSGVEEPVPASEIGTFASDDGAATDIAGAATAIAGAATAIAGAAS